MEIVDLDLERMKARIVGETLAKLAKLSPGDRADVVARIAVSLEDEASAGPVLPAQDAQPRKPGRPRGSGTSGGGKPTATLLVLLKPGNKLSISQMADKLYGSHDERPRNNVRSLLANLKRRKLVQRVGPGRWEVLPH